MKKYVLDTNFFFNLQIQSGLGNNPREIIEAITDYAQKLSQTDKAQFFMPPSILKEFLTFVSEDDQYVQDFIASVTTQSPHMQSLNVSADIVYKLVEDIRKRSYRGLQIAEEELTLMGEDMMGKSDLGKIEKQKSFGEHISKLRERYRNATRTKFLDSVADLDLIILTKEIDGILISSDEGVIEWGRQFGIVELMPNLLKNQLDQLLQA